jgi:hypothetical protein
MTITDRWLIESTQSSSKTEQYDSYLVYWMYREWTRDFRCCKRDYKRAIRHLKNGTLFKWYEVKTQSIKSQARSMLAGVANSKELHQFPDDGTNMMIPTDLATMKRSNESTSDYNITYMTPRVAGIVADVRREKDWAEN